jgi:hypothetical protein
MVNSTASVSSLRKFVSGDRVRGRYDEKCPESFRARSGTVMSYVIGSGYFIRFDDGKEEYVYAHWLEATEVEQG